MSPELKILKENTQILANAGDDYINWVDLLIINDIPYLGLLSPDRELLYWIDVEGIKHRSSEGAIHEWAIYVQYEIHLGVFDYDFTDHFLVFADHEAAFIVPLGYTKNMTHMRSWPIPLGSPEYPDYQTLMQEVATLKTHQLLGIE